VALALILVALALGAFSTMVFLWQWMAGPPAQPYCLLLLVAIAAVFLKVFLSVKKRIPQPPLRSDAQRMFRGLPVACGLLGLAYASFSVLQNVKAMPHGGFDAWAVWNLHARFLYRGSAGIWHNLFVPALSWSQNDYPLLVPGLISGAWTITGAERPWMPVVVGIVCAALLIGILCSAVSALSRDERGWLAGLVLLATPSFLLYSVVQAADIPLALYILITVALLQFADAWPQVRQPMLVLAGLSAGFAAWTKNEGLLFVLAVLASHLLSLTLLRAWRALGNNLMMISLGLAPMLIVLYGFKVFLAVFENPVETFGYVSSVERYQEILRGFLDQAKGFGGTWDTGGIHPAVLLGVFAMLYAKPIRKISPTSLGLILLIVSMFGGYFLVYLFSSFSHVRGYIQGSLDRLYLQLWPACLFIVATLLPPANKRADV
jgi:hypothetical protein